MATDPVCGMQVEEDKAAATAEHEGRHYYFCSKGCQEAFVQEPERYIQAARGENS